MQIAEQQGNTAPIRLGNVWLIVATMAHQVLNAEGMPSGVPHVIVMDEAGDLVAIGPNHPDYAASRFVYGAVCAHTSETDVIRFAAQLRRASVEVTKA